MSARREPIRLTRSTVCHEALALVDAEGLEALSMRRLAGRLGCEAMSLYHHVRDKADLLDALHAAVLGDLEPETPGDHARAGRARQPAWRQLLGGLTRALRTALLRHPNVIPLFTSRQVTAPEAVAVLNRVHDAFLTSGFTAAETDRAVYVTGMFTIGHAIFEKNARNDATFDFGLEALLDAVAIDNRKSRRNTGRRK
jgi:AcrR family transcriptional regulator